MNNITLAILFTLTFASLSEVQAQKEPAVREVPWETLQGLYGNPDPKDNYLYLERHKGEE